MKRIGIQFCPSCGCYWLPSNRQEATRNILQKCNICDVTVKYSWFGFTILGILLYILLATGTIGLLKTIAHEVLVIFLIIAVLRAVRQHRAVKKNARDKQEDTDDIK